MVRSVTMARMTNSNCESRHSSGDPGTILYKEFTYWNMFYGCSDIMLCVQEFGGWKLRVRNMHIVR
jgi:hypothetical protein